MKILNLLRWPLGGILLGIAMAGYAGDAAVDWTDAVTGSSVQSPQPGSAKAQGMNVLPVEPESGAGTMVLTNEQYRIGPSDELDIEVFQAPDLSGMERVNARGYINMPLIGQVKVAGLTQDEAEALIAEKLAEDYLQHPYVNIDIKEFVSQRVTVLGSVKSPGVYPLKGPTTLLQAIALAGGIGPIADENAVVVFRANDAGQVVGYVVNLEEVQNGSKSDPRVVGNDRIVVPESGSRAAIKGITDTLRGFIGFGTL